MSHQDSTTCVEYRPITGSPGYRVGDDGSVWSCVRRGAARVKIGTTWHRLGVTLNEFGYQWLRIGGARKKIRKVHHLVLEAFVGPCPPGLVCRHLDGNPANNRLKNICWGTRKENMEDMIRHGRSARGIKNGQSKLTEAKVHKALALVASGLSQAEVGRRLGVHQCMICRIVNRKRWKWLTHKITQ
jgi:hypothetical protein